MTEIIGYTAVVISLGCRVVGTIMFLYLVGWGAGRLFRIGM